MDAGIQLTIEIPDGYGSGSTLSGTLDATADANGQITFDNVTVNLPDGINTASRAFSFTGTINNGTITLYLLNSGTEEWTTVFISR